MALQFKIGDSVNISTKFVKGTIAFIGLTKFAPGEWIGVILTEKKGKNNGSVQGIEYFSCAEDFGMFVKPANVELCAPIQLPSKVYMSL